MFTVINERHYDAYAAFLRAVTGLALPELKLHFTDLDKIDALLDSLKPRTGSISLRRPGQLLRFYFGMNGKALSYNELGACYKVAAPSIRRTVKDLIFRVKRTKYRELIKIIEHWHELAKPKLVIDACLLKIRRLEAELAETRIKLEQAYALNNCLDAADVAGNAVLSMFIYELDVSARTENCLNRVTNNQTIGEVLELDERQLLAIPSFGRKCLAELNAKLQPHGLQIKKRQSHSSTAKGG
jgi:hypothetical protein